ncbi:hypothetical protein CCM_07233 [Cordyceps militaris CM01]|uniref:DUF7702 domain-containing protein n=1 Tax=Cordyceps militaris (strain CM01) TaxID=983644 RepID=G3JM89_CORMM|nr:uncharacterized protein CCM_07233 [Cordyceps militaris CM01]EGX90813.1 hypothetical protein CCM_07233 [Cordyceps militaris CM01]
MHRPFDTYDGLAVAQIVLYTFFLVGAVILCLKHGFLKSAGWRYLLALALVRIVGSALRLATISAPTDENLYIGWLVLTGLGLGPLILMLLGLLSRTFESMRRNGHDIVKPIFHRAVQTLMLVAMILLIVGGFSATFTIGAGGAPQVSYAVTSRVGSGLMIVVFVLLCLETLLAVVNQGYVAQGEHRVVFAVIACLPFVLVRLVYSELLVFAHVRSTAWLMLAMEVAMEVIVVLICEILGFALARAPPEERKPADVEAQSMPAHGNLHSQNGYPMAQYPAESVPRKTRRERKRERRQRR